MSSQADTRIPAAQVARRGAMRTDEEESARGVVVIDRGRTAQVSEIRILHGRPVLTRAPAVPPAPRECSVRPIATTPCGSDLNALAGLKDVGAPSSVRVGHEMVGVVVERGSEVERLRQGDVVNLKPHRYTENHAASCPRGTSTRSYQCQGAGCTTHAGFHWDGGFTTLGTFAPDQLEVVPTDLVDQRWAEDLPPGALMTLVEPVACCRTAMTVIEEASAFSGTCTDAFAGSALVIGAGPIGVITARELLARGCAEVVLKDISPERVVLAVWILGDQRARGFEKRDARREFPLVIVTANCMAAIHDGEAFVGPQGMLYLMSGLDPDGRQLKDPGGVWFYEAVHRQGGWLLSVGKRGPRKVAGHSGYTEAVFSTSARWVAQHGEVLNRLITHVIHGLASSHLVSRFPDVVDHWSVPGTPVVLPLLGRAVPPQAQGMKIAIIPSA